MLRQDVRQLGLTVWGDCARATVIRITDGRSAPGGKSALLVAV